MPGSECSQATHLYSFGNNNSEIDEKANWLFIVAAEQQHIHHQQSSGGCSCMILYWFTSCTSQATAQMAKAAVDGNAEAPASKAVLVAELTEQ